MHGQRVKIAKTPALHGTGKGSKPCTCKGQMGTLYGVVNEDRSPVGFVRLDKGGRIGVPMSDLIFFGTVDA